MNAAMIFSRGVWRRGLPSASCVRAARFSRRGFSRHGDLLGIVGLSCHIVSVALRTRPIHDDYSDAITEIQLPSSRERRVAAATAAFISGSRPSFAISTSSAAAVVPPGEVTFLRKRRGVFRRQMQEFAGAGDGDAREFFGKCRRQTRGSARRARDIPPAGRHRPAPSPTPRSRRPSAPRRRSTRRRRSRRAVVPPARVAPASRARSGRRR